MDAVTLEMIKEGLYSAAAPDGCPVRVVAVSSSFCVLRTYRHPCCRKYTAGVFSEA